MLVLLACCGVLGSVAQCASAHATLLRSTPAAKARSAVAPSAVTLQFSEPVQILRGVDVSVVDQGGRSVASGPARTSPRDASVITVPLRSRLPAASYSVRYRVISADSHGIEDALSFATGGAGLRPPIQGSAGGPSETSAWTVAARFVELAGLGTLLALLAFRWLVWVPAVRRARHLSRADHDLALDEGTRLFWMAFWRAGAVAVVAEAYMLVVKTAVIEGRSVVGALTHPSAAYELLAYSRYGELYGWRVALVIALLAVGFWAWLSETSADAVPQRSRWPASAVLMAALSIATLELVSYQGHASQAPLPTASVLVDSLHLGAVAIWLGGLPCLAAVLVRAPRLLPDAGRGLAADVLARFSALALTAVVVIGASGLARAVGQLSSPAQLWDTAYGRSLIYKTVLLWPIAFLAFRNRRVLVALARVRRPTLATFGLVRRNVAMELAVGVAIVLVAALLAAQVPGRV